MRRLLWLLAFCALAVGVSLVARFNEGYLLLVLPPYRVELSLNLALLLVILAFALLYALLRALVFSVSLPARVRVFRQRRRQQKAARGFADALRLLGTVGEPINPEAWRWYHEVVGDGRCPIVDTWWQTETGGILITPLPGATPLKPGSATRPFFGVVPEIVDADGKEHDILRDNMPFGRPGHGEFGTYFIGYSGRLWVIETMLRRMFLGEPPGAYDRILDFSTALSGATFFAPTRPVLKSLVQAAQKRFA